jgi:hypothetical protein
MIYPEELYLIQAQTGKLIKSRYLGVFRVVVCAAGEDFESVARRTERVSLQFHTLQLQWGSEVDDGQANSLKIGSDALNGGCNPVFCLC